MRTSFDLIVIGTGEAGSAVAAGCRAAGWEVAIVDSRDFGGTCGLRGCDPKKVLRGAAEVVDHRLRMENKGVTGETRIDWPALMRFKRTFTDPFPKAREDGFTRAGIVTFHGLARFTDRTSVQVGDDLLEGRHVVVATGAWPIVLGIPGEEHLTRSDQFLELDQLPRRLLFVGGGYIGFEFAHIASRAGAQVTILNRGKRPLKRFDPDLVAELAERTGGLGVDLHNNATVTGVEGTPGRFQVTASIDSRTETFDADMVVHSAGRAPELAGLELPAAGVDFDRHGIKVDEHLRSVSNPAVYAAGDAANSGGLPETPLAEYEGGLVSRNLLDENRHRVDYRGMGSVVYTIPALAGVGLTEDEARRQGLRFDVHQADTSSWYSARRVAEPASRYKVLLEQGTGRVLGAHLLGPEADEFANVFSLAIRAEVPADKLRETPFAYPTQASNMGWMV